MISKICIWAELDLQEKLYGKPITVADREMVEEKVDSVLSEATSFDVAFLVVGDPFGSVPVGFSFQFRFL
jgi:diphthamide biosynthesis methyltransferase